MRIDNSNTGSINLFWVLFDNLGFSYIWDNFDRTFICFQLITQRMRNQFIQTWSATKHTMPTT